MSADNWSICPRCDALHIKEQEKVANKVADAYGKISRTEWEQMKAEAKKIKPLELTLREDYEFFLDRDGSFCAAYSASCNVCDFKHEFKHEEQLAF